ncbi:outer membrane beta-barrel protein [Vibrio superstes]|uniref:Membrane protein n=1 Tax=Vibrio superstes NBRC 103154 TaxID=1219062 RepID=A0A511QLF6_9VIBR|nr:outer membrane beta-barrel protein [Vibrio superstes]GEM78101.1 membrane protein [Vibrio superstes NBRC 103154]
MKLNTIAVLVGTLLVSGTTFAGETNGWYVGGGVGKPSFDDGGFVSDLAKDNSNITNASLDAEGMSYTLYGGYFFNRIVGVEASYNDYGKVNAKFTNTSSGQQSNISTKVFSPKSFSVSANLGYTFDNGLRPFVKVGVSAIDLQQSDNVMILDGDTGPAGHYGIGLDYSPMDAFQGLTLRVAYEGDITEIDSKYDDSSSTWNMSTVYGGIAYKF